jgi:hypothetical protein
MPHLTTTEQFKILQDHRMDDEQPIYLREKWAKNATIPNRPYDVRIIDSLIIQTQ